jgi:hypothetical protein
MDKRLTDGIRIATEDFNNLVSELTPEAFEASHTGKWTAGQDLKHLIKSMKLTNFVYTLPLFMLKALFGKPNRKSRTEAELRERYRKALVKGVKAPRMLKPGKVSHAQRNMLLKKHQVETERLCSRLERLGEDVLESCLVKHPAIGKVNLREMAFLTRLHTEHHTRLLKAKLNGTAADEL